jgi:hypothetical protein
MSGQGVQQAEAEHATAQTRSGSIEPDRAPALGQDELVADAASGLRGLSSSFQLLALQRVAGNRAVTNLVQRAPATGTAAPTARELSSEELIELVKQHPERVLLTELEEGERVVFDNAWRSGGGSKEVAAFEDSTKNIRIAPRRLSEGTRGQIYKILSSHDRAKNAAAAERAAAQSANRRAAGLADTGAAEAQPAGGAKGKAGGTEAKLAGAETQVAGAGMEGIRGASTAAPTVRELGSEELIQLVKEHPERVLLTELESGEQVVFDNAWRSAGGKGKVTAFEDSTKRIRVAPRRLSEGARGQIYQILKEHNLASGETAAAERSAAKAAERRMGGMAETPAALSAIEGPAAGGAEGKTGGTSIPSAGQTPTTPVVDAQGPAQTPDDDPRRRSGMAHSPTLDASGGVATAPTMPGTRGPSVGAAGPATAAPVSAPAAPGSAGQAPAPAVAPLNGPPTIQSQEEEGDFYDAPPAPPRNRPAGMRPAVPASQEEAEAAFRANPASVYRSKNDSLHRQYWRTDGSTPPPIYKSGNTYIIAPKIEGPNLPPPTPEPVEADEGAEGANVRALGEHLDARLRAKSSIPSAGQTPTTPVVDAQGQARTPNDDPRRTSGIGPTLDASGGVATAPTMLAGGGPAPTEPDPATRPTVPGLDDTSRPPAAPSTSPAGPRTAQGAGMGPAQPVTPTSAPAGEAVPEYSRPPVQSPGSRATRTRERKVSASPLGVLTTKPSIGYSSEEKTETVVGKTDEGADIKTTNASKSQVNLGTKGVDVSKEISHTTAGGAKVAAGGNVSFDWSGNMSAVGSATFESQHGLSISPTVGHSDQADASDPQYVEGVGFLVTFKISSTDSVGVGGGKSLGGTHASASVGKSKAEFQSGSRIFKTLDEATDFRDNVRKRAERSVFMPPPTSVAGALQIKLGESGGGGTSTATTIGGSASFGEGPIQGDVGYTHVSTSTEEVSVMRVGQTTVDVTRTFSEDTTRDPHIKALGFSNTKGHAGETGLALTYRFDLATESGSAAFRRWCEGPVPPGDGATNLRTKYFESSNAHDEYEFPVKFSAKWKSHKFEFKEIDDAGNVTEGFGGGQDRDTRTGWAARNITGDKEQHANAQIVATLNNGKESYAARFAVSGKSGDSNLEELGKMFSGAKHDAGESSGYWLATAQINPAIVHELERDNPAFRNAKTTEDKMRIYSDYAEERGAQMIGGQVSAGGDRLAWNLELPGDDNFPGERGRAKLNDLRQRLSAQLKEKPDTAYTVAREAKEALEKLESRFEAVRDKKKYTDLPDGLRDEQLQVISMHRSEFIELRQRALSVESRHDPNEKIEDVEKRATSGHGYDTFDPKEKDRVRLQDSMTLSDDAIQKNRAAIWSASKAVGQVRTSPDVIQFDDRVDKQKMLAMTASVEGKISEAFALQRQGNALEAQVKLLREKFDHEVDPEPRLRAMRPLEQKLREHSEVLTEQHDKLVEIGRDLYPVARFSAMQKPPGNAFWQSVSEAREEEPEQTPMALP